MSLEYRARAVAVSDSKTGEKVLICGCEGGITVKIFMPSDVADFAIRELNPVEAPCA
jgi:predicted transcriptional regulator